MLDRVGYRVASSAAWLGDLSVFAARSVREAFRPPYEIAETLRQLHELGVQSAPLIAVAGFAVGVVLSMHTRASLERFGAETMIPAGLALALVKETGPLTAGLLLSGRIGAGIGAELGAMKVTEQIDTLEATAVDSFKYLVVAPNGCVCDCPPRSDNRDECRGDRRWVSGRGDDCADVSAAVFHPCLFADGLHGPDSGNAQDDRLWIHHRGRVVPYLGMNTTQGTEGVRQASTRSVVMSSVGLIIVNVVLVRLIFILFPGAA